MSFLKLFAGPTSEKLEKKGDALLDSGLWGQAKLEYERALIKAEKEGSLSLNRKGHLIRKIAKVSEALAKDHQKTAENLIEGGYYDDARPFLSLALEVTSDEARALELETLTKNSSPFNRPKRMKNWPRNITGWPMNRPRMLSMRQRSMSSTMPYAVPCLWIFRRHTYPTAKILKSVILR